MKTSFAWCLAMASWMAGSPAASASASAEAIWQQLAAGGMVVLMRHGEVMAGPGNGNSLERDPTCARERNLSSAGKAQARRVGEAFRGRKIAVAGVRHSPFCRTTDTARLAFGGGTPTDFLSLREILGADEAAAQTRAMAGAIGSFAGPGNLVLITHEPNINAVSFELMKPADFLVLRPRGGSDFEEIGVIRAGAD